MTKVIDLTGQRFGRLTVVRRGENTTKGSVRWWCDCQCGNTSLVRTDHLRVGAIRSCGCWHIEQVKSLAFDIDGQRFGMLVAVEAAVAANGKRAWRCVCDCGGETVAITSNLRNGNTESCGCRKGSRVGPENNNWTETPGYVGMHGRVRRRRGKATDHACVDCAGPAVDWSCSRDAQHVTDDKGRYYSLDVDDYDARCKPCHAAYDRKTVPLG